MHLNEIVLPTFADVESAATQIAGVAHRTPVVTSRTINSRTGADVFFKCENLQRGGAFKFRGAYNALSRLSPDERRRGVVTFSSGNHAQAIALAGQLLDIPRVIVMPSDAPAVKRTATEGYGGEVVLYDREREDREEIGRRLARERGLTLIPPYDHPHIIAGQGTAALEIFQDVKELDYLIVPIGGGGLISGCSVAAKNLFPGVRVIGVETEGANDCFQSFRAGKIVKLASVDTIADGMRTLCVGTLNFEIILRYVDDVITIRDGDILPMMKFFAERMKIVVEPTGAVAPAAVMKKAIGASGKRVCALISGGNVDPEMLRKML